MLRVRVEAKDEMPDGTPGLLPLPSQVAALTADVMADMTKHDREIGWRVREVWLA